MATSNLLHVIFDRILSALRGSNPDLKVRALWTCLRVVSTFTSECTGVWLIHMTGSPGQNELVLRLLSKLRYLDDMAEIAWKVILVSDSQSMVNIPSPRSFFRMTLSQDMLKDSIEKDVESQLDLVIRAHSSVSYAKSKARQMVRKLLPNLKLAGFFLQTLPYFSPPTPEVLADFADAFSSTETALLAVLERVPKYSRAWVRQVFELTCFSFRPLTTTELEIAMAARAATDCQGVYELAERVGYGTTQHVVALIPGILRIQEGGIYIVHDELKSLLTQSPDDAWYHIGDGHLNMALACYNYLSINLRYGRGGVETLAAIIVETRQARAAPGYLKETRLKSPVFQFSQYASLYWCDHFLCSKDDQPSMPWLGEPDLFKDMLALRHYSKPRLSDDDRLPKELLPENLRQKLGMTEFDAFRLAVQTVDRQQSRAFVDLIYPPTPSEDATSVREWLLSNYPRFTVSESILNHPHVLDWLFEHDKDSLFSNASDILVSIVSRNDHPLLLNFLDKLDGQTLDEHISLAETSANALHDAVFWGLADITKTLLSYQVTLPRGLQIDTEKPSLFQTAIITGDKQTIQCLVDTGADLNALIPNRRGFLGRDAAPLHIAGQLADLGIVRLLLDAGADVRLAADDGITPLWTASLEYHTSMCQLLVEHGAIVTMGDAAYWQQPLHFPARYSYMPKANSIANMLIEALKKQFPRFREDGSQDSQGFAAIINAQNGADKKTALMYAASVGNLDLVKTLVDVGADVGLQDYYGYNAMRRAAMINHVDIVRVMADNGCDVDSDRSDGRRCLHDACIWGSQEVVEELLNRNAEPNHVDEEKRSPITMAARFSVHRCVKQMIPVSSRENICRAMLSAAQKGYHKILTMLLDAGADIDYTDVYGNTPLHFASWNSNARVTQVLLSRMPDTNYTDCKSCTPTFYAAGRGALECLKLLLDARADVEVEDSNVKRALMIAAERSPDCFRLLLERGAQTVLPENIEKPDSGPFSVGVSFLAGLVGACGVDVVRIYLEHLKPRVSDEAFSSELNEALGMAAYSHKFEALRLLLEYGADPNAMITKLNIKHGSPIGIAVVYGDSDTVKFLLDNATTPVDLNRIDDYRDTPLNIAVVHPSKTRMQTIELLLQYGADASISSGRYGTLLNTVCQSPDYELLDLVLRQPGVSRDAADQLGRLPIHLAVVGERDMQHLKLLLTDRSTFGSQDKQGRNVLSWASLAGKASLVEDILKECPGLINLPDRDGWTPLHWAARKGDPEMMKCLIKHGAERKAKTHEGWTPKHVAIYHGASGDLELLPEDGDKSDDEGLPTEAAKKVTESECD
ncbi:ankyrin repeat-containing domain protein [Hypoxylon sp. FL1284]|nr:ankyrin repeat-containing domain protein [Hypoxylon sp. FL1284]